MPRLFPVLPAALAMAGAALAGGCVKPAANPAPADLHRALGAADPAHVADPRRAAEGEARGEVLTFDLEAFAQAGLPNPHVAVPAIVRALCAPARFEEPHEMRIVGRHLVIRHEPAVVRRAAAIVDALERAKLARIRLDLHLVEVPAALAAELDRALSPTDGRLPAELRAKIVAGLDAGGGAAPEAVRTLARRQLRLTNGTWQSVTDGRSRRPVTAVRVEQGRPVEVQETVEDGLTLNAAAWIAATGDAVVALEAALQTELPGEKARRVEVRFHPDPEDRKVEVKAGIDLPELRTTAMRAQARVGRGAWHVVGRAPAPDDGRVVLALARADWEPRNPLAVTLDGLLPPGRRAAMIPVALPEGLREAAQARAQGYVWDLKTGRSQSEGNKWLEAEQQRQAFHVQTVSNVVAIAGTSIGVAGGEALGGWRGATPPPTGAWQPLLPEALAAKLRRIEQAVWDDRAALIFQWDELVCLQDERTTAAVAELFAEVQAWRNRPVRVRAEWVEVPPGIADRALAGDLDVEAALAEIRAVREPRIAAPFEVLARSGAWSEIASSRNHSVLWGFMGEGGASPEVRALDEGGKLSVLPRLYGNGRVELDVRFVFNELDRASLDPVEAAGGFVHRPRFTQSSIEQVIAVESGRPVLIVASSAGAGAGGVRALLVTAGY